MIVITGGAGFIGSNLAAALAERGERIAVCDHLGETSLGADGLGADGLGANGKWRNIAKLEIEDVVSPDQLLAFLSGAADRLRALVHLGAISDTTAPGDDALVETNFRHTNLGDPTMVARKDVRNGKTKKEVHQGIQV